MSIDFKHGQIFRLTKDVQNPDPDRRGRNMRRNGYRDYEWAEKMEVWPKGMRFRYAEHQEETYKHVTIENFDSDLHKAIPPKIMNSKWEGKDDTKNLRVIENPKWAALVDALEPEPDSFATFMASLSNDSDAGIGAAWEMLQALHDTGRLSKDEIRAAYREVRGVR